MRNIPQETPAIYAWLMLAGVIGVIAGMIIAIAALMSTSALAPALASILNQAEKALIFASILIFTSLYIITIATFWKKRNFDHSNEVKIVTSRDHNQALVIPKARPWFQSLWSRYRVSTTTFSVFILFGVIIWQSFPDQMQQLVCWFYKFASA